MRHLLILAASAFGAQAADAQFVVVNRCAPTFTVVNRSAPACSVCSPCECAAGVCPACPATSSGLPAALTIGGVAHVRGPDGVYRPQSSPVTSAAPVYQYGSSCANGQCGAPPTAFRRR